MKAYVAANFVPMAVPDIQYCNIGLLTFSSFISIFILNLEELLWKFSQSVSNITEYYSHSYSYS